jgi:two-component sensor histidine kinase
MIIQSQHSLNIVYIWGSADMTDNDDDGRIDATLLVSSLWSSCPQSSQLIVRNQQDVVPQMQAMVPILMLMHEQYQNVVRFVPIMV